MRWPSGSGSGRRPWSHLGDRSEAEDVVQQAWLRLHRADTGIESLPAWLTTVTTRLCLDRLRARVPVPRAEIVVPGAAPDPADDVALAETVGTALHVVLDRLTPAERVAFVLHDSFGFEFSTIARVLNTSPAAARGGDLVALLHLLAPDAAITADDAAILAGTPERIEGRREVATFFRSSAHAALPVFIGDRPGAAWFHRGRAMVVFDFTVMAGAVHRITFRARPDALAQVERRDGERRRTPDAVGGHTYRGADRRSGEPGTQPDHEEDQHEDDDLPPAGRTLRPGAPW